MKLKRSANIWRLIALLLLAGGVLFSFRSNVTENIIARIVIDEIIFEDSEREQAIQNLMDNRQVKAVILQVNSPGGTALASERLYYALHKLASKKPLVVVMGTVAASGGYMISLAAKHIIAGNGTLTGSIGVVVQTAEFTELAKKLGISLINLKSGEQKAVPSPFEKLPKQSESVIRSAINDNFDFFIELVQESRNLTPEQLSLIKDGRIFTGRQAKEINLVDEIGGEDEAIEWLHKVQNVNKKLPVRSVEIKQKKRLWEGFVPASKVLLKFINEVPMLIFKGQTI
jgi:protease-4